MTQRNLLEIFSAGYFLVNEKIRVVEWRGDQAIMSNDLYDALSVEGSPVVVKTGQTHYKVTPQSAVPSGTLAIPDKSGDNEYRDILVARPGNAEYLTGGML